MSTVKTVEAKLHEIIQPLLEQGYYLATYGYRLAGERIANGTDPDANGAICIKGALVAAQLGEEALGIDWRFLCGIEAGFEGWKRTVHDEWYQLGERIRETYGA